MRMRSRTALAAALLFAVLQPYPAAQESQTGSISGHVTNCTGTTLPGARVALSGPPGRIPLTVVSDEHGNFRFSGLSAGSYSLEAGIPGYLTFSRAGIQLTAGRAVASDVMLAYDPQGRVVYEVLRPGLNMDLPTLWRSVDAVVHLRIQKTLGARRSRQADGPCENVYLEHQASILEAFRRVQGKPEAPGVDFLQAAPAPGYNGPKIITGNYWQVFRPGDELVAFLVWEDSEGAFLAYFTVPVRDGRVESIDLREIEFAMKLDVFLKMLRAMME